MIFETRKSAFIYHYFQFMVKQVFFTVCNITIEDTLYSFNFTLQHTHSFKTHDWYYTYNYETSCK